MRKWFLAGLVMLAGCGGLSSVTQQGRSNGHSGGGSAPMGRLRTIGFEVGLGGLTDIDGSGDGNAAGAISSAVVRSGLKSLVFGAGINGASSFWTLDLNSGDQAINKTQFGRIYLNFTNLPNATVRVCQWSVGATKIVSARLTTAGVLQLWNETGTPAQIGSDSAVAIQTGKFYRIELSCFVNTGSVDTCQLMLDGVSVASGSSLTLTDSALSRFQAGFIDAAGASKVGYIDDVAINDSTGASQNSWPGEGNVVWDGPVSDNARGTNWFEGTSATASLWDAVNNAPPVGGAVNQADGTLKEVQNKVSDATGNYDANLADYRTAGIADTDTIVLVQPVFSVGSSVTNGCTGAEAFISNPTGPAETSMSFNTIAGNWPTGWRTDWLAAIVGDIPTANRGTNPVIRIGKRQATTRVAACCLMGSYVEYVQGFAPQVKSYRPLSLSRM